MQRLIILGFIGLLVSCSDGKKTAALYPVDSLLHAQARYLSEKKALLKKVIVLGGKQEEISLSPKDIIAWRNELEVFTALDVINKPINRSYYSIEDISDSRSNLKVKSFATKEDLPVRYIKIYYYQTPNKLRRLEAQFKESNSLYNSSRDLAMDFQQFGDTIVLTSYNIVGGQKMLLDDSVQYRISGTLSGLN
ncbi:MAG TPA: hypothetical protein VK589_00825 [Chryseolinea sp.]|nr:hypothetical protein [Chryseolinea sp.]